jgi:hypothetical protein
MEAGPLITRPATTTTTHHAGQFIAALFVLVVTGRGWRETNTQQASGGSVAATTGVVLPMRGGLLKSFVANAWQGAAGLSNTMPNVRQRGDMKAVGGAVVELHRGFRKVDVKTYTTRLATTYTI